MSQSIRENFHEIMKYGNTNVPVPKWEWGYMGETLESWYQQGLNKKYGPQIDWEISTPTASLYSTAWKSVSSSSIERLPRCITVSGGGFYHQTQGFPLDRDVSAALKLDPGQKLVNVNLLFSPEFDIEIIEEDEEVLIYQDLDGITRKFMKTVGVIPTAIDHPVHDWESWQSIKQSRLNSTAITKRLPANWGNLTAEYKNRDYVLVLGGYPYGFFGTPAHLLGYETLFFCFHDAPELIHDIQNTFLTLWMNCIEEILSCTDVDCFILWEDMSSGTGSMISPQSIREFILPYYKRLTDFLKAHGVSIIFVDTDGDCTDLIPIFVEGGITGVYPMETGTGMDLHHIRKNFPHLQMMGGVPKEKLTYGKEKGDAIISEAASLIETGRYIPFADHGITPDVSWEDFSYYRRSLNSVCDNPGTSRMRNGG